MEKTKPESSDRRNIIIGIGNEFRGDDGVGIYVASKLRQCNIAGYEIIEYISDGSGMVELWKNSEKVIVIDAALSGSKYGTIFRYEVGQDTIPAKLFKACSSHAIGLFEAIEISRKLNSLPKKMIVYGIEGKSFEMGTEISPETIECAEKVILQILRDIEG